MKKFLISTILIVISLSTKAQSLQLFDPAIHWILETPKVEKGRLTFVNYSKEKLGINTLIWKFLPNGRIDYDYQSDESIFACAGVDFLDMDTDECHWSYDPNNTQLTLQIKGGYASIDDFVFKRVYQVSLLDSNDDYGYVLTPIKEYFFNDLRN